VKDNIYTLDRYEGNQAVFLKQSDESEQLLIQRNKIQIQLKEGDVVQIVEDGDVYDISYLDDKTKAQKEHVENLLEQLRNRKN